MSKPKKPHPVVVSVELLRARPFVSSSLKVGPDHHILALRMSDGAELVPALQDPPMAFVQYFGSHWPRSVRRKWYLHLARKLCEEIGVGYARPLQLSAL